MPSVAIDENLERIRSDLLRQGLSYEPLMEDLLDHVCCMVEDHMNEGYDFQSSYELAKERIGDRRLAEIQHQTLLNLDKKHQRMKNFTYFFGLTSALITILGAFFKWMHWPGANILISAGIVLVVGVFLPLFFILNYREQSERKNPVYPIVGYITLLLLLAGALFKIMHWPGAGLMTQLGLAVLVIGFVPLYVVNAFQRSGSEKVRLPYIVMLLVGIALVTLFGSTRISKYAIDIYMDEIEVAEQNLTDIENSTDHLLMVARDSIHADKRLQINRIHEKSAELQSFLDQLREGLLESVDQPGASIQEVKGKDIRRRGWSDAAMYDVETEFIAEARAFKSMLDEMLLDPVLRAQIHDHMEFTRKVWPYKFGGKLFMGEPFVIDYHMITNISRSIALTEYVAINYILEH